MQKLAYMYFIQLITTWIWQNIDIASPDGTKAHRYIVHSQKTALVQRAPGLLRPGLPYTNNGQDPYIGQTVIEHTE